MRYLTIFCAAAILSLILALVVKSLARRWKIMDDPASAPERKSQKKPIPLLGGWAIIATVIIGGLGVYFGTSWWVGASFGGGKLLWILGGAVIIALGGFLDDKYNLKPRISILAPLLAVVCALVGGVGVQFISNPAGGIIAFAPWAGICLTIVWLLAMIYATKFMDGLDGLVTGISGIGGLVIAGLCLITPFFQPDVALLALLFAGACAGFLVLNFHPAKIYLGESGSLFCGFILGVLAIISGSKIATTLLVLGIPLLDLLWVVARRVFKYHKSPFKGDRLHLPFQLLDAGLSHKQTVLLLYVWSLIFGLSALFMRGWQKVAAIALLILMLAILFVWIARRQKRAAKSAV